MPRLIFMTANDLRKNLWPELALPALARHGWEITVVGINAEESAMARCLPYPCRRHNLTSLSQGRLSSELDIARWLQHCRTGPYDVIYLHSHVLGSRAGLGLIGPLFGKRLIYHTHDYFDPITHPLHMRLEAITAQRSSYFINGEYHRGYICRTMYKLRSPMLVLPPNLPAAFPVSLYSDKVRVEMGARDPKDILLIVHGGQSSLRATDETLEALSLLPNRFRLVMTGERTSSLVKKLEMLAIADRVVCLGHLEYAALLSYTASADIGIMLHANNDLGNFFQAPGRLTEYLACGLPILASHYTALQLLTLKYRVGLCVDPNSAREIASALLEMETAIHSGRFGRKAIREAFLDHFAFDHWEGAVIQVFDSLSDRHRTYRDHPPDFGKLGVPFCSVPLTDESRE